MSLDTLSSTFYCLRENTLFSRSPGVLAHPHLWESDVNNARASLDAFPRRLVVSPKQWVDTQSRKSKFPGKRIDGSTKTYIA